MGCGSFLLTDNNFTMKQKIKEALKTRAKNLGLDESAFDGVAAFGETIVKEDAEIEGFVNSEATINLLKTYQSVADKARAAAIAKNEPTPQPSDNGNNPPKPKPETPDIAALIEAALDKKLNPITERLTQFETAQSQKSAVAALNDLKASWDYAKGYPTECEDAYERVMELYEVSGKKWTAEELTTKFKEKFNKAVSKKGVDTTKPFQSDGGAGDKPDFSKELEVLKAEGIELPE